MLNKKLANLTNENTDFEAKYNSLNSVYFLIF